MTPALLADVRAGDSGAREVALDELMGLGLSLDHADLVALLMSAQPEWLDDDAIRAIRLAVDRGIRRERYRHLSDGTPASLGLRVTWADDRAPGRIHQITSMSFIDTGTVEIGAVQTSTSKLSAAPQGSEVDCSSCDDNWLARIRRPSLSVDANLVPTDPDGGDPGVRDSRSEPGG